MENYYAPSSLDPAVVIDNSGLEVAQNVNAPLIFFNGSSDTQLIPVLATSWTESPNGMTYTFNLRSGVYYSDNDPFNAYVVWYNVYRDMFMNQPVDFVFSLGLNTSGVTVGDVNSLNNAQNIPNATLLQVMENPHNAVTVVNATQFQLHLYTPYSAFLYSIDTSPWVFVDPYVVQQNGGVVANQPNSYMSVNGSNIGDGPYVVKSYVPNQYTILEANPHYWGQNITNNLVLNPAKIPTITINYKTVDLTRELDLTSNRAQAAVVPFPDVPNLLADNKNLFIPNIGLSGSLEWIALNAYKWPLNDSLVRQAIIEATNVSEIQQIAYGGYATPVVGPDLHGFFGYNNSITPTPFNVTAAANLLTEAGFPGGKGLPVMNLPYTISSYETSAVDILQQNLAAIGITLVPQAVTSAALVELISAPANTTQAPYLIYNNWTFFPDFSAYESVVDAQFGVFTFYHNATVYNIIEKSNTQLNQTLRAQEISTITSDLQQSYAFLWLSQDLAVYDTGAGGGPIVMNTCLSGMFYNTAMNGIYYNPVYYTCNPT